MAQEVKLEELNPEYLLERIDIFKKILAINNGSFERYIYYGTFLIKMASDKEDAEDKIAKILISQMRTQIPILIEYGIKLKNKKILDGVKELDELFLNSDSCVEIAMLHSMLIQKSIEIVSSGGKLGDDSEIIPIMEEIGEKISNLPERNDLTAIFELEQSKK